MPSNHPSDALPAKATEFVGYQLWREPEPEGALRLTLFLRGRMIELIPDDETAKQVEGFYDLEHNPVPDPI